MDLPIHYRSASTVQRKAVREEYVRLQNGNCYFCKKPMTEAPAKFVQKAAIREKLFPPGFFTRPQHLHHCHNTGMTVGTVHARCNAYLWQYLGE